MAQTPALLWLRLDLRLDDNPALMAAIAHGGPIVPVFIWAPEEEGTWALASASRWWLHQSLKSLDASLRTIGSRLIVRCGPTQSALDTLLKETGATAVFWNRRYEPALIERDAKIKAALKQRGLLVESHNSALLFEPWTMQTRQGNPYQVYTPYWKACSATTPEVPVDAPKKLRVPTSWPTSLPLEALKLEPTIDWTGGIRSHWTPGEQGATARLKRFLQRIGSYADQRDQPDIEGTSALSPYLHFGEISPRRLWIEARKGEGRKGVEVYLKELVWREFAHHLLYHFPTTTDAPLREDFARFPWEPNAKMLRAWQRGETGYPLVDAGMRQLWTTGWMHNRVRMVVASFLVKHLLTPWQEGAKWFWDTLVDADLANNTFGWQWTAGCGADAAPYFRVFNPVLQGERFDPEGHYVKRWLPELEGIPAKWVHRPWEEPGFETGKTYPSPIVDHAEARTRALTAFATIKAR